MYLLCVEAGACNEPTSKGSYTHSSYYGNAEYDNYPVIYVDWNMAKTYCEWADRRLPTEAEWEKAARGENAFTYPWGNDAPKDNLLNYDSAVGDTTEVGKFPEGASPYGALDLAGNVWEWAADWYDGGYYSNSPSANPPGPVSGQYRAPLGGAWGSSDYYVRSAYRGRVNPPGSDTDIGFRCAKSQNEQPGSSPLAPARTETPQSSQTSQPTKTDTPQPTETSIPLTQTTIPTTSNLGIGSKITGQDGMTLLYVPAGEFTMGSDTDNSWEKPAHTVSLGAFWIDQTEITNEMYSKCVTAAACQAPKETNSYRRPTYYGNKNYDEYPVIEVNWSMASAYCEWVGRRLPTEAEWEKAARGPDGNIYPWGNDSDGLLANFCDGSCPIPNSFTPNDGYAETSPVGSYPNGVSPYGALDMAGNVLEWVNDWYSGTYYSSSPSSNPEGPDSGQYRVLRGGAWSTSVSIIRSAWRGRYVPTDTDYDIGFRCAMSATQ
jgi:formylglycine-generating enzyme required for sulfatase activity